MLVEVCKLVSLCFQDSPDARGHSKSNKFYVEILGFGCQMVLLGVV